MPVIGDLGADGTMSALAWNAATVIAREGRRFGIPQSSAIKSIKRGLLDAAFAWHDRDGRACAHCEARKQLIRRLAARWIAMTLSRK
jgi:hypothetical protein